MPEWHSEHPYALHLDFQLIIFQKADDINPQKWNNFTLYPLVSIISWFCLSPYWLFLSTRGLRGTFCCPWIIFPCRGSFEASDWSSDSLKFELGLAVGSHRAFSFDFILALTDNHQQTVYFTFFKVPYASSKRIPLKLEPPPNSTGNFLSDCTVQLLLHSVGDHVATQESKVPQPCLSSFLFLNHVSTRQGHSSKSHVSAINWKEKLSFTHRILLRPNVWISNTKQFLDFCGRLVSYNLVEFWHYLELMQTPEVKSSVSQDYPPSPVQMPVTNPRHHLCC